MQTSAFSDESKYIGKVRSSIWQPRLVTRTEVVPADVTVTNQSPQDCAASSPEVAHSTGSSLPESVRLAHNP